MLKPLLLLTILLLSLASSTAFSKSWRINNNPGGVDADFTTLQDAHNGAAAKDTLYLEGSPNYYGSLTCTKKLIIIGPGYYQGENNIANINTATALVYSITMNDGSQGSEIMGLDFNGSSITINTSDIVIQRNKFNNSNGDNYPIYTAGDIQLGSGAKNVFIRQNFGVSISGGSVNSGILITNNLISADNYSDDNTTSNSLNLNEFTTAIVQNNIFYSGTVKASRSTFTNNIMVKGIYEKGENVAANNIGSGTQFGTANGNKSNINMNAVFVGSGSPDARWQLKPGSPAKGAGYGSTTAKPVDAGMFWGNTSYKLSGLPGIPHIYFIDVQAVGSNSDPIDVTIKVKSTN